MFDATLATRNSLGSDRLPLTTHNSQLTTHQQAAVICQEVTKEFGAGDAKTAALRGVNAALYAGQLSLIVGPSGCGKTTLISIIGGLLNPTEGSVTVLGTELSKLSGRGLVEFRAKNVGFVFQQYNLLPALSATENAAVPLIISGWSRRRACAKAREILAAVGLEHRADAFPAQLSSGQQQRVAIARALIHEPRLLLCDEPTSALDAKAGHTVMELIKDVAVQPERAVIVVTHDRRVYGFGDRIVEMSDGRIECIEDISKEMNHERSALANPPADLGLEHGSARFLPRAANFAKSRADGAV
jgi:putative ABC transport system ATP-binding protein